MARQISLGQVTLTRLQSYVWVVEPQGNTVSVREKYVVTDDGYTAAPEGRQEREVSLTDTERTALARAFAKHRASAAARESVEV